MLYSVQERNTGDWNGFAFIPDAEDIGVSCYTSMSTVGLQLITGVDVEAPETVFEGFLGQEPAIRKLKFFLSSTGASTPIFPTLLFTGSHGLGKTYLAKKVAANMHRRFIEVNAATLEDGNDFLGRILMERVNSASTPATIFLDEAHALKNSVADVLLTLLSPNDTGKNYVPYGSYLLEYDMSKINLILATTDAFSVVNTLVNRTERIYFECYKASELLDMLRFYLPDIALDCNVNELVDACRGRGRDTFKLAQHIKRYCQMQSKKVLNNTGWQELKSILEIYPLGLNKQERDVLYLIGINGKISAANIAAEMMISEESLVLELEPRLRELGLITTSSKGRVLTDEGRRYWREKIAVMQE